MGARLCMVSFKDIRDIRHSVEVQAETLFEAAVTAMTLFAKDPWLEKIGPATVLDVEIREPSTSHNVAARPTSESGASFPATSIWSRNDIPHS